MIESDKLLSLEDGDDNRDDSEELRDAKKVLLHFTKTDRRNTITCTIRLGRRKVFMKKTYDLVIRDDEID